MPLTQQQIDALNAELASTTSRVSGDGMSVEAKSNDEIIKALQYNQSMTDSSSGKLPIRLYRMVSPGAIAGR